MVGLSILFAAAIAFTDVDATVAYEAAKDFVEECTPRDAGTVRGRLAASWILDRVSRAGVDASTDIFKAQTPDGERTFTNVVVEFPGTNANANASWVILLSHYDTAPKIGKGFQGANDGASTTGLLIALAGAIRRAGKQGDSIALIWTDAEEARVAYSPTDGFQGAKRALAAFKEKKRGIKMALGLDMLGDKDLHISLPPNGSRTLNKIILIAAAREGLKDYVSLGNEPVQDDFIIFDVDDAAVANLIDFSYGPNNSYWHTPQDTIDKISAKSLGISGKLVAATLRLVER